MSSELKCVRVFWENGNLKREEFFNSDGQYHREHGPAYCRWYWDGKLEYEEYWLNGKLNNAAGPAVRYWYENGQLEHEAYCLNGRKLTKAEWEAAAKPAPCDGKVVVE